MSSALDLLTEFGLTGLEAEIYAFLITEWPASGYRIAQAIRKPAANTYKALETLEQKGVILAEEGDKRRFKPVPPTELIARWRSERDRKAVLLEKLLQAPAAQTEDDRVYTCRSRALAIGRAQALLQSAQHEVLLLADAGTLDELQEEAQAATLRDVNVMFATRNKPTLRIVVDGGRSVAGEEDYFFVSDGHRVSQEVRRGLVAELALDRINHMLEEGAGGKRISRYLATLESGTAVAE